MLRLETIVEGMDWGRETVAGRRRSRSRYCLPFGCGLQSRLPSGGRAEISMPGVVRSYSVVVSSSFARFSPQKRFPRLAALSVTQLNRDDFTAPTDHPRRRSTPSIRPLPPLTVALNLPSPRSRLSSV